MPSFQFELEYAKSNRSACKHCKEKIDKDAIRIGIKAVAAVDEEADASARQKVHSMEATKWHHSGCFQKAKGQVWFKKNLPQEAKSCPGYDALKAEDQAKVEAIFAACRGGSAAEAEEASTPLAGKKRAAAAVDGKSTEGESTQKKSRFFADKENKEPTASVLSQKETDAVEAVKAEFGKKNIEALKLLLAKNGLPKAGRKDELLERVAEAKALGVPPTCSTCNKVKLRFSKATGSFSCPGSFDEEAKRFKKCKGPEDGADIVRTPWEELSA
mmetsp:Transcript_5750/g.10349  ORF Transcript_5750/g.10349 Transcript_5750/m.10349 type:complete len:272 (+) Transcript_5750:51-866(+)|eukprot:CAMPEP_0197652896 /NCGR_PEP_ID=MMETSP1338-20131121/34724_1 /TAXON_ID=43686 ORGANISM="Pelagodinium beii, Strain RCC1491" /NCGR_SAMPLE_ID=MMETSP1338 /ASSEMBLY_ACC=CAM_ASM_000754 /LENGTH=271 /DNA_ID=CAMNT_0043227859 /DNA_START=43 /DNA_END=858 /DNA_ORIENTATION=-